MPTARYGLAAAVYENQIYAIGGETVQGVTGVVERYDPETNTWEERSPKPLPVTDVEGAVIGGLIYVPGGRLSSGDVTDVLEIYDPREDKWSQGAGLPTALSAYALAAFEGRLYLFGGWDGSSYVASVYEYNPNQDVWQARAPMSIARGYTGAAVAGGKIYVIGGTNERQILSINEEYIPERDHGKDSPWTERAPLPEGRSAMGISSIAGIIQVVGGENESLSSLASLEYFPHRDEWLVVESPFIHSWAHLGLIPLEGFLYAIGGHVDDAPMPYNLAYKAIYTVVVPVVR